MDSWFLVAVRGSSGSEKILAEDPVRRLCLGKLKNFPIQLLCIATLILQSFFLNYRMATSLESTLHWLWFIADGFVVATFVASFYLKEWRLEHVAVKHKHHSDFAKGLPYSSLSWLIYAILLSARVCRVFVTEIHNEEDFADLNMCICATAVICIFFTWGHHHHHESLARRASIMALVKLFTIDLLDTVDILEVLFVTAEHHADFPVALEVIILSVVSLNLMRPSLVLLSLFVDHFGSHIRALKVKIVKSLFELFLLNIPLLIIRSYIAARYNEMISVFLVKNIIGIMFSIVEIYDCSYDIYDEKKVVDKKMSVEMLDVESSHGEDNTDSNQEQSRLNGEKDNGAEPSDHAANESSELTA